MEKAYESLYRKIVSLELEPGQRLDEVHLQDILGIGRTPVREAIQRLVADFLVETVPSRGFFVRPLTLQNTKAAFSALKVLECGVADLLSDEDIPYSIAQMERANQRVKAAIQESDIMDLVEANSLFHEAYAISCNNPYIIQALKKVRCETNRLAYLSYGNSMNAGNLKDHYASVIDQHERIIAAVFHRRISDLKNVVCRHIEIFQGRIFRYLAGD